MTTKISFLVFLACLSSISKAEEVDEENEPNEHVGSDLGVDGGDQAASPANPDSSSSIQSMMDKLASKVTSEEDQTLIKQMMENLKGEHEKHKEQQEALSKLTAEKERMVAAAEGQLAQRHNFPQPPLEKITKKDGTSFYTRIVSSDDPPMRMGNWPEDEEPPSPRPPSDDESESGSGLAIPSKQGPSTMFTMPAGRDMKEVLKEIMANDGDIRKVPGLKPWKPSDDKRNENQIGWDDDDSTNGFNDDADDDVQVENEGDGTGIVSRNKGAATTLSDANHQISMLRIDLQTLKQEKTMKEKSAALQIANLKQKLAETRRVMEELKVFSKRDKDDAADLRRHVDKVEEQLETSRRSLLAAESELAEKKLVDEQLATLKAEMKAAEATLKEKELLVVHWQAEHAKVDKYSDELLRENSAKDTDWNSRWAEYQKRHDSQTAAWKENYAKEKKKTKKATRKLAEVEGELKSTRETLESTTKQLEEATEASKNLEEKIASTTIQLEEKAAAAQERVTAVRAEFDELQEKLTKTQVEVSEDRDNRSLLEVTIGALRKEKEQMQKDTEAAAQMATQIAAQQDAEKERWRKDAEAAAQNTARLEAELENLEKKMVVCVKMLVGLLVFVLALLVPGLCIYCCCSATAKEEDNPDVKHSRSEVASESGATKKSKRERKEK